jgi:type I restriction enzyme R subunit
VTIQTFPYAMEAIVTDKTLKGKNFAVIIDEAHNSQTGTTAAKLQTALAMSGQGKMASLTVEELLEQLQKSRARPDNISYFAFTGTPKAFHVDAVWPRSPTRRSRHPRTICPEAFHRTKCARPLRKASSWMC